MSNTCIIYSRLNASVILERNEIRLERNETRLERSETHLERNDTRLARNETRSGHLHLSGTVRGNRSGGAGDLFSVVEGD